MTTAVPLELTDPTEAPTYGDGPLSRWCKKALYDPRDEVFVRLTPKVSAIMLGSMALLWRFFQWRYVPLYFAVWGWYAPPVILMLHCTMHRPFIRKPKWLDRIHPHVMTFFFGIPTAYTQHHMGMHHMEDNMGEDLSSTLRYKRDNPLHFVVYVSRFFFLGLYEVTAYLRRKRRNAMAKRVVWGEVVHLSFIAIALWINWPFSLVAFAIPCGMVRLMMMVGNWGQHAFINTARKNNGLANSITCINGGYNKRAFNDGYHIGHHLKANRHWTELPKDFLDNQDLYVRENVIVFKTIDFFMVSVLLWSGQWKILAKCFVRLDGQPKSDEEVIALLKARVLPVVEEEWVASVAAAT